VDDCTSWACALPELYSTQITPSVNGTSLTLPTPFYQAHPPATDPPPVTLRATTPTTVTLDTPLGLDNPLPWSIALLEPRLSLWFHKDRKHARAQPREGQSREGQSREGQSREGQSREGQSREGGTLGGSSYVQVLDIAPHEPSVVIAEASGTQTFALTTTGYVADGPGGSCLVPACYKAGGKKGCEMCALGELLERFTGAHPVSLNAKLQLRGAQGGLVTVHSALSLFADQSEQADSPPRFEQRGTAFFEELARERASPTPLGKLVWSSLDVWESIEASIEKGVFSDKSFRAQMLLNLTNVFTAPVSFSRYQIGTIYMQDVDGVEPHAVLMALTKFHADFGPDAAHQLVQDVTSAISSHTIRPGHRTSTRVQAAMHWESVVRYMDELYMKDQNCFSLANAYADIHLHADGSAHAAALTFGFSPRGMGSFKRRACHVPATCVPKANTWLTGGCSSKRCATHGSAKLGKGGTISLVSGPKQKGSAFSTERAPLLDGFEATFDFEMTRGCNPIVWGLCDPLSGGFALVLHGAKDAAPLGHACEVRAVVVEDGQLNPEVAGLVMSNDTTISCAGYSKLPHSIGVVFSLASGPVGNRYWSVAAPVVSMLSDWPRGSLSLWVNGDVRDTTTYDGPARGTAQHGAESGFDEGKHSATVRYSAAMRMLYVYLDGRTAPSLWAELDPHDLGLGARPQLSAGFTATSPSSGEALSATVSKWAVRTTKGDGAKSRLLEDGEVAAKVGEPAAVHIDTRDSCLLPLVAGSQSWKVEIVGPTGSKVHVDGVHDLADGTHRVDFTAHSPGEHHLKAVLSEDGDEDGDYFRATFAVAASHAS
jgi:hypothetical protein